MQHTLLLHNWRCFGHNAFEIPEHSFALIDSNGAGKSSLLTALYSIYTGRSWPGIKLGENMTAGQSYFGVLTDMPDWSFSGQIGSTGRLSTRFQKPQLSEDSVWPVLFTYSPDDNYWLSLPRNYKLGKLDILIGSINPDYLGLISKLDKFVRAKQKALKNSQFTDFRMVVVITESIHELSKKIWDIRKGFLDYIESNFGEYVDWINSPLEEWIVEYEISDSFGVRRRFDTRLINTELSEQQIQKLWEKERMIGKVMYGAQRDDFNFVCQSIKAQHSLSRGENRLLTLFVKYLTQQKVLEMEPRSQIWWLLDDVYNELDSHREDILQTKVLDFANFSIYSGTRIPQTSTTTYTIADLVRKI